MSGERTRLDGGVDDGLARAGGNLAGVVEWANEAFGRLTGIPLAETVNKPVTRFLERAGIDLEVVDFVAQHFFEGRTCRVELPFERPDGRAIDVLLEVEALRDPHGEIDRFLAVARERGAEPDPRDPDAEVRPPDPAAASPEPVARRAPSTAVESLDLSAEVERLIARATRVDRRDRTGPIEPARSPMVDLALARSLAPIEGAPADLAALVSALLGGAGSALAADANGWGVITVTTGRTAPSRLFVSKVHAIPACPGGEAAPRSYLEVHDTGPPLAPGAIERIRRGDAGPDRREAELARAVEAARRLGATLQLDSTPGCGNQALVLFPTRAGTTR